MDNLTYREYLADPDMRARIEREARRARAEAMWAYVLHPVARLVIGGFARLGRKAAQALQAYS
jgi:hypothetical protein